MEIFSLLLLGIIAGTLAGLLGVGGGIIIVPTLVWIFHYQPEIPNTSIMQIAVGTSLATISITSISSIIAHHKYGAVQWRIVWQLAPGIIIGALFGAIIADALTSDTLQKILALFIILVSVPFFFTPSSHRKLPRHLHFVGMFIGQISALVGIGGGSLTVPFLVWCNISICNAIGTSAACGFPIALFGTLGFITTGWNTKGLPAWSSGYIYWPAFVAITPMTLLFAQFGAKLAHNIPVGRLKIIFAIFMAVMGIKMLLA